MGGWISRKGFPSDGKGFLHADVPQPQALSVTLQCGPSLGPRGAGDLRMKAWQGETEIAVERGP